MKRTWNGGNAVNGIMIVSLLAGVLFLCLAARGLWKAKAWFGARRLTAEIVGIEHQEAWKGEEVIANEDSCTEVTLQFFCDGRMVRKKKKYQGLLETPQSCGKRMPVFYVPDTDRWILRKDVRANWIWQLLAAFFFLCMAFCFVEAGGGTAAELTADGVIGPSYAGRALRISAGCLSLLAGFQCGRKIVPACFSPIFFLLWWKFQESRGALEAVEAKFAGMVCRTEPEHEEHDYPVFLYCSQGEWRKWYSNNIMIKGDYQLGEYDTIYREKRTGDFYQRPTGLDIFTAAIFGFVFLVCLVFAVSLLGFGGNLIYTGITGVWE
ncbi:hypothetical protein FND36_04805 [Lachnospiraceae bacterium KGMB03038]|nr:hypothetical protein FND36_04805 [Lachnospiraceae bacterium KGMB03038]